MVKAGGESLASCNRGGISSVVRRSLVFGLAVVTLLSSAAKPAPKARPVKQVGATPSAPGHVAAPPSSSLRSIGTTADVTEKEHEDGHGASAPDPKKPTSSKIDQIPVGDATPAASASVMISPARKARQAEHVKVKAQVMEELDAFHSDPEYQFLRGLVEGGSDRSSLNARRAAAGADAEEEKLSQRAEQDLKAREDSLAARVAADGQKLRTRNRNAGDLVKKEQRQGTAKADEATPEGSGTKTIPKDGLPEQGYNGAGMPKDKVTYDDMDSKVEDWHAEYGHAPNKIGKAEKSSAGSGLGVAAAPKSINALLLTALALYIF